MKKELLNELENYFYSERYEEMPQYRTEYIDDRVVKWLEGKGISKKEYVCSDIEDAITQGEVAAERQGFFRGYEYCLTMLGILVGGGGTVNGEY